jgi:5-methylcytosine-specific restriction endonuclease McrA
MSRPLSPVALPGRCAYCNRLLRSMAPGRPSHRATRDHILPRCMGRVPQEVRNLRLSCSRCNTLRAQVGHCPAVLRLVLEALPRFGGQARVAAEALNVWRPEGIPA